MKTLRFIRRVFKLVMIVLLILSVFPKVEISVICRQQREYHSLSRKEQRIPVRPLIPDKEIDSEKHDGNHCRSQRVGEQNRFALNIIKLEHPV